jgi:nitrogen fixation NifU-like protein
MSSLKFGGGWVLDLKSLYTQIITENSRAMHNRHPVLGATTSLQGINPTCGDDITLQFKVEDGIITDAGFIGAGCAISQASASLMIDLVKGKSVEEAKHCIDVFFKVIKGEDVDEDIEEVLEDASALQGIAKVPARVKCAVLCWHTMEEALDGKESSSFSCL